MNNMITINKAVERLHNDDIHISNYCLRQWVRNGEIQVRKIGRKQLLYYPTLLEYITNRPNGD